MFGGISNPTNGFVDVVGEQAGLDLEGARETEVAVAEADMEGLKK